ncbi:hypothetical protein AVEN_219443-1 [Araneus ventricosus]|uniref:Uncharacterized protein n=1 Tax=Araneus ventricosus TaxID=182803 RepID=A0A4Y2BPD0_ARAVE|nr:hypothetical protein AVEN_219443-1 [Araneus ventricosus]
MTRGERKQRFAVGDDNQPPGKSGTRNISATPQKGWSKRFLSWGLEGLETGKEEIETRLNSESDSDSNLGSRERRFCSQVSARDPVLERVPSPRENRLPTLGWISS